MSFPVQTARMFSRTEVEALKPGKLGCYGLFKEDGWVFIGTGDIRERLLAHLAGDNPCILEQRPTHWMFIVTADMHTEERRLIARLSPTCNKSR